MIRRYLSDWRGRSWLALNRSSLAQPDARERARLLVDLSVIARHDARTGIQRAVRAIWNELNRYTHPDYEFAPVYSGASRGYCYATTTPDGGGLRRTRQVVRCQPGDKFLGLDLSAHYLPRWVDQLSAWRRAGATIHSVVYDLLPLRHPDWFTPGTRRHFPQWFEAVRRHSDQLLCISDAVANDVRSEIGTDSDAPRVGRLYLSGNIEGSAPSGGMPADIASLLASVATRPTVLMVGTVEPRKGYDVAIAAFDHLWAAHPEIAPNLLIVGKAGWRTNALQQKLRQHPCAGERLVWREEVSDEALTALYENCCAVLVASRGEGFGLPLSEAAFHRRWVLARDLPVFREQNLPNCLYFGDDDAAALAKAILDLVDHAQKGPPPPTALLDWSECLTRLLATIGIDPGPLVLRDGKRTEAAAPVA